MNKCELVEKYGIEVLERNCFFDSYYKDSVSYRLVLNDTYLVFSFGLEYRDSIPHNQKIGYINFDDADIFEYDNTKLIQEKFNSDYEKELSLLKEKYNYKG